MTEQSATLPDPVPDVAIRQELRVDADNFVYVDGVKVARLVANGEGRRCLEFIDKDRRRASRRGSDRVTIAIQELLDTLGY